MAKPDPEMRWDAAFLRQHAQDARVAEFEARKNEDWLAAVDYMQQVMADSERAHLSCPAAACRRARCCTLHQPPCIGRFGIESLPEFDEAFIRKTYAALQIGRRDAAT